jgi:O-methyltransferase
MTQQWIDELIARQGLDAAVAAVLAMTGPTDDRLRALRQTGGALLDAGREADIAVLLTQAAELQPKLAWAELLRARLAERRGDRAAGLRHLRLAFGLDPADAAIVTPYVQALLTAGLHADAQQVRREHRDHTEHAHARLPRWHEPGRVPLAALDAASRNRRLYLDLLELTVSNWIYGDSRNQLGELLPFSAEARAAGRDIPSQAHSMIGLQRLRHLRVLAEQALDESIAGDFVEAGVWRGGACILLAGVLKAHGAIDRRVVVADSFEGLPAPDPRYPKDDLSAFQFHLREELAVSLEAVRSNFERYGLLSEQVAFLKGLFRDTLPSYPYGPIAILRMDGDLYSSTMDTLVHLYPRVVPGGWVIADDYGVVIDARRAVLDFRANHGITAQMTAVDGDAVYWRKG